MPDVGVLNLQIHDDSAKAAEGLGRLATALGRVRNAVGGGLRISGVANHIKALNQVLKDAIPEQSLANLERLANAIEKINSSGGIKMTGIRDAMRDVEAHNPAEAVQRQVTEAMDVGLKDVESTTQETDDLMESFIKIGEAALGSARSIESVTNEATQLSQSGVMDEIYKATHHDPEKTWIYNENGELEIYAEYLERIAELRERIANTPVEITDAEFLKDQNAYKNTKWDIVKEDLTHKYEQLGISQSALENARSFEEAKNWSDELFQSVKQTRQAVDDLLSSLNRPVKMNWASSIDQMLGINTQAKSAADSMSAFMQGMQGDSPIAAQVRELNPELQELCTEAINSGKGASELTGKMVDLDGELKKKKRDTEEVTTAFQGLKTGMSRLFGPIGNLLKQFARIAKYRMLRSVIKQITGGVSEGVENYYRYSQAIKGAFAPAMDTAATALQQMKNSIGAALAPLIQSLIPLLQTVVSWFVSLVNYANQFIALIRGQSTWSRATSQSAKAFDKVNKSAKGASAAVKDLLADWDELNIIQSETGGNGGGSGNTKKIQDYLGMFEEVNKFDNKVKALVDGIKDKFGDVLNLIKEIGIGILAWNVSKAFTGLLSTLTGFVASGIVLDLTFRITEIMSDQFLRTGDAGWLIGDALTTLIGGALTRRILSTVLGGGAARLAIPLTLAISAMANIKSILGNTDVSALSKENIVQTILAALKMGGAATLATHSFFGASWGGSAVAGLASFGMTLGVVFGLKALFQTSKEGLSSEVVKTDALAALGIGGGSAALAYRITRDASVAGMVGGGLLMGTLGVLLGAEAIIITGQKGKIDEQVYLADILSAIGIGTGTGMYLYGAGWVASSSAAATVGLSAGAGTLGLLFGVEAVMVAGKKGKIDGEVYALDALSALGVGVSATAAAAAAGFSAGVVALIGGGAAIATVGALLAVEMVIAEANRSEIKWGNYEATQEEIKAFVEAEIFDGAAPTVKLSLANAKITELGQSKEDLEKQMSEVLTELDVVSIGLKKGADSDIRNKVDKLIKTYNQTAKSYQDALQIAVTLVPVKDENGEDQSKNILKNSASGWAGLEQTMQRLSNELTSAFDIAYNKDLDEVTRNGAKASIEKISGMMTQIVDAITAGQAKAKVTMALNKEISNLTQGSMDKLVEEYGKQRDELIAELTKTSTDAAEGLLAQQYAYEKLAEYALKEAGGDVTNATYQEYISKAKQAAADYATIMNNVVENATEEADRVLQRSDGFKKIRETLLGKTFNSISLDPKDLLAAGGLQGVPEEMGKAFEEMLSQTDLTDAKNKMEEALILILYDAVGGSNWETYKKYIDAGIISFGDFFSKDLIDTMADAMGLPADGEIRDAWNSIINEILGIGQEEGEGTEGIQVDIPFHLNPIYDVPEGAGFDVETEGEVTTGKRPWTPGRNTNAEPSLGVDRTSGADTQVVVTMDGDQQEGNIRSGVQMGTGQLLSALQTIAQTVSDISKKKFSVNVTPSTMFGRMGSKSAEMLSAVTGEDE